MPDRPRSGILHRLFSIVLSALVMTSAFLGLPARADDDDPWPGIRRELFADKPIVEGGVAVRLFGPKRADDAAIVPLTIYLSAEMAAKADTVTLVIDRNPAPVSAVFAFGPVYRDGGDVGDRTIEMRVRMDSFSNVRAILKTTDGALYSDARFIAAAGGCSASSLKDPDEALRDLGRSKLRVVEEKTRAPLWREIQLQIKHPNFTGLQIDPVSHGYTPARFVNRIDIAAKGRPIVSVEGGIGISEDPNFRFTLAATGVEAVTFAATDTEGAKFAGEAGVE